mmetsp:Transcript_9857/g.21402  ORF Transcript_9857/g.21402 Transcript_9857/m.21402 type:complete len:209 (-) Transcript_9857:2075-2701(-)
MRDSAASVSISSDATGSSWSVLVVDLDDEVTSATPRFLNGRLGEFPPSQSSSSSLLLGAALFFFPLTFLSYRRFPSCNSPSRMGRRHSSNSFSTSVVAASVIAFSLPVGEGDLLKDFPGCLLLLLESPETLSAASSSSSFVRIDEVTSHQMVVWSFRIKQMLHVGAIGFRRPLDPEESLTDEDVSSRESFDSRYPESSSSEDDDSGRC